MKVGVKLKNPPHYSTGVNDSCWAQAAESVVGLCLVWSVCCGTTAVITSVFFTSIFSPFKPNDLPADLLSFHISLFITLNHVHVKPSKDTVVISFFLFLQSNRGQCNP